MDEYQQGVKAVKSNVIKINDQTGAANVWRLFINLNISFLLIFVGQPLITAGIPFICLCPECISKRATATFITVRPVVHLNLRKKSRGTLDQICRK